MTKIKSEVLRIEVEYSATHIQLTEDSDGWLHDSWVTSINGFSFDYKTGTGHRTPMPGVKTNWSSPNSKEYIIGNTYAVKPPLDDVLYSLLLDSEALNCDFEEWADNFGYDSNSKKAESIFEACIENATSLQLALHKNDLTEYSEKFSEY